MFFLLPVIAGVVGSAITASEVALGVGTAVAIGAGIKGAIDLKDASDYQDIARYKTNEAVVKTKKEVSKTQDELTEFARLKVRTFNGVLKNALDYLKSNKEINPERIGRLNNLYKASRAKYSAGISHGSISLDCTNLIDENLNFDLEDFARIALGGPIGFLMTSSEKLTEGVRANSEADVKSELLQADRKICKAIRKSVGEGTKLIEAFSRRIESLISCGPSAAVAVLPMAENLFAVIDVDLVDREGKLIDSAANLYRTKMREVLNG